jgi:RNA methyltransferase, TrmH family
MYISSLQNPTIKRIVKLRDHRSQRRAEGVMLVEGRAEIQLAITAGHRPQVLVSAPDLSNGTLEAGAGEQLSVSRAVFEKISYRENPDGWLAVFPIPHNALDDLKLRPTPLLIVAESIEKPGNLGAILRTADAARVDAVLVCDGRVDISNPNVVRASRGALFTVPTVETSNADALAYLQARSIRIAAATPAATTEFTQADLHGALAVAVGTEDQGLTDFWLKHAGTTVRIPMNGQVNSLNVSIATALIVFEAVRQRGRP